MAKQNAKPKPTECPLCKKSPCHEALFNKFGTNKRGDITGNLVNAFKKKDSTFDLKLHPFYLKYGILGFIRNVIENGEKVAIREVFVPDAIEGHHLITCESVGGDKWKQIFEAFGYDINDPQNGAFFPCDMFVACHLRVPLHQGNHNATFGSMSHEDKTTILNYVDSVRNEIDYIKETAIKKDLCKGLTDESIKKFNEQMLTHSQTIFEHLHGFRWTLTADGFDFKESEVGCYDRYRTIRKKRNGMKKDKTVSLSSLKTRDISKVLSENLKGKGRCNRDHLDDGCTAFYPFVEWYKKCRYNELDEERFK